MRVRIKRIAFLLAALFLLTALSGCGKKASEPDDSDLPALIIGSDEYLPYFYTDGDGDFAGIDVDLAREACRRLGLRAEFRQITWGNKDAYLESGEIDCLWGSFSMTGREDRYAWAGPYMTSRQVLLVAEDSPVTTLSDLENRRVGVQFTSKPDELFSAGGEIGFPTLRSLYCFSGTEELLAALRKGYVDAIAGHETMFLEHMKTATGSYRILEEPLLEVRLGVAFAKNDGEQAAARLTEVLRDMYEDGFVASVLERYGVSAERATVGE
ncbi:MAG TPA: amino acid ABC transporter substrate-binding protein [Clostridiales bacterium]|nr:amino acid ABC transporter substrate-binding protein [Clostridiales bacterium]